MEEIALRLGNQKEGEGLVTKEIGRQRNRSERMRWVSLSVPMALSLTPDFNYSYINYYVR